jgi:hypothetical protein
LPQRQAQKHVKQHSPTLFWLLVAATIAVDAVVVRWMVQAGPMSKTAFLYDALVTGQLGVVCLWGAFAARHAWLAWIAELSAVGIAGGLTAWVAKLSIAEACGIHGLYVATLATAFWILKRIPAWRRLAGEADPAVWQYSIGHLLAAMTVVALLFGALRGSVLLTSAYDSWRFVVLLTLGDVVLVTATVFVWLWAAWLPNWWPRVGAAFAPALVVGGIEAALASIGALGSSFENPQLRNSLDLVAYTLATSLVIFLFLEIAPIVDRCQRADKTPPAGTIDLS